MSLRSPAPCFDCPGEGAKLCCRGIRTERDVLEAAGFDADTTPIDVLMRQGGVGLVTAWQMEHGDDAYPE